MSAVWISPLVWLLEGNIRPAIIRGDMSEWCLLLVQTRAIEMEQHGTSSVSFFQAPASCNASVQLLAPTAPYATSPLQPFNALHDASLLF
jgi:hypothetical protein